MGMANGMVQQRGGMNKEIILFFNYINHIKFMKNKKVVTKLEQIQDSVTDTYPYLTKEEQKRIVRQDFAYWLVRGRTLGSRINPKTGKREFYTKGKSIALLI